MDEALKGLKEYMASTLKKSQESLQRDLETVYRVWDHMLKHTLDYPKMFVTTYQLDPLWAAHKEDTRGELRALKSVIDA